MSFSEELVLNEIRLIPSFLTRFLKIQKNNTRFWRTRSEKILNKQKIYKWDVDRIISSIFGNAVLKASASNNSIPIFQEAIANCFKAIVETQNDKLLNAKPEIYNHIFLYIVIRSIDSFSGYVTRNILMNVNSEIVSYLFSRFVIYPLMKDASRFFTISVVNDVVHVKVDTKQMNKLFRKEATKQLATSDKKVIAQVIKTRRRALSTLLSVHRLIVNTVLLSLERLKNMRLYK